MGCRFGVGLRTKASWLVAFGVSYGLSACYPRLWANDPKTTGDDPRTNVSTTQPVDGVPYCPGGHRAIACVLGANCRITEAGCQVCQCLSASH
jgi:hypothetical protein